MDYFLPMISKDEFEEKVLKLAEKWVLKRCAFCYPGTLVSVEGMLDFKCIKCGRVQPWFCYLLYSRAIY